MILRGSTAVQAGYPVAAVGPSTHARCSFWAIQQSDRIERCAAGADRPARRRFRGFDARAVCDFVPNDRSRDHASTVIDIEVRAMNT